MKHFVLALLVILLAVAPTPAGSYRVGYVDTNGYQFGNDGYWHYNGSLYYRTAYQSPGYWSGCVYYPGSYSYSYSLYTPPAYTAPAYTPPAVTAPDFWTKLAEFKASEKESTLRLQALREAGYLVPSLNYGIGNYGYSGHGYGYNQQQLTYGANATTTYAYGAQQALYNTGDLLQLFQMSNQHVLNSQKLASDGQSGFQQLVALDGNNRAEIARIVAKRDLAIAILQSLNGPNSITTQGYTITIGQGGTTTTDASKVPPDTKAKNDAAWKALAQAKCAKCHTGANAKKGFDIAEFPTLSSDNQDVVIGRLTTADPKLMMPRDFGDDSKPGVALTAAEIQLFLTQKVGKPGAPLPNPMDQPKP